jgi:MraZ protein
MFRGRHYHSIDSKGRLSVPSEYRMEYQRLSQRPPILTNLHECLALYPAEDWERFEQSLLDVSAIQIEAQDLQRFMISGAVECPIDAQGRINIPTYLREHARLERDVAIAGVGPFVQIWDRALFEQDHVRIRSDYTRISNAVAQVQAQRPRG